ncbi:hypothetical protein TWF730_011178 [Orbilia blumenaviensis]|uniref:Uncharacterized protein n=1 Tax=Orbilia blumenaviensis TaxID=1796055 RepID=A0AAV9UJV4_9PEZI
MNHLLSSLGHRIGFRFNLVPYSIRYGVSNVLEAKTTLNRRCQILGYLRSGTWTVHYMSKTVLADLQSIFSSGSQDELITKEIVNTTGHSRYRDVRAPQIVNSSKLDEVMESDSRLQTLRDTLRALSRQNMNDQIDEEMKSVSRNIRNRIRQLKAKVLTEEREDFFKNIDTQDINRQLRGLNESEDSSQKHPVRIEEPLSGPRKSLAERMQVGGNPNVIDPPLIKYLISYIKGTSEWVRKRECRPSLETFSYDADLNTIPGNTRVGITTVEEIRTKRRYKRAQEDALTAEQEAQETEAQARELVLVTNEFTEKAIEFQRMAMAERERIRRAKMQAESAERIFITKMERLKRQEEETERSSASTATALETRKRKLLEQLEEEKKIKRSRKKEETTVKQEIEELKSQLTMAKMLNKVEHEKLSGSRNLRNALEGNRPNECEALVVITQDIENNYQVIEDIRNVDKPVNEITDEAFISRTSLEEPRGKSREWFHLKKHQLTEVQADDEFKRKVQELNILPESSINRKECWEPRSAEKAYRALREMMDAKT